MKIEFSEVHKWAQGLEEFHLVAGHRGTGTLSSRRAHLECELMVRPNGECLILGTGPLEAFPADSGFNRIEFSGKSLDGAFEASAPSVSLREGHIEERGWALFVPVNGSVTINYRPGRACRVEAALLNLDIRNSESESVIGSVLAAQTSETTVEFRPSPQIDRLLTLRSIGSIDSPSLSKFSFHIPDEWTEDQAISFAVDVGWFCSFPAGQHTGVPVLTLSDAKGKILKRVLTQPITGEFRRSSRIIPPHCIAQFFSESFPEYLRMKKSSIAWSKLASYCCSIEDSIYLEQKLISLLTALEFFLATYLIEKGQTEDQIRDATLPGLIGQFRRIAGTNIPRDYSEDDIRLLRNDLIHPKPGSTKPRRADLDRWRLFLFRLVLMRMGYTGDVFSPAAEILSRSKVDDFRTECNTWPIG